MTATFDDRNQTLGNYNNAFVDNLSFTVGDPTLTAAPLTPPTSNVGQLDHVFVIYMENKGVGDIVGSANAPYINSLINTYGYADNYYSLGHPSNPNYFRILGGSDYGIDYNTTHNAIAAPNLMQEMDGQGVTWAGYGQSMPAPGTILSTGDYAVDELPFAQFDYVYNNTPAFQAAHLFPLTYLSGALNLPNTPSSFPNFTWIAANESNNMEGPVSSPADFAKWALSQATTNQYNVAAGDQFIQQQVSTIQASNTWTDPNSKDAIIITWDEDYNNLSLGIGNEGNNVPMIVIPNQGATTYNAVTNPIPMQSGHFVATANYNEYSLMATIEDSLGLAPLTDQRHVRPTHERILDLIVDPASRGRMPNFCTLVLDVQPSPRPRTPPQLRRVVPRASRIVRRRFHSVV